MELVTPPDDTCIMNGVTRQTILGMKDHIESNFNLKVVEREISIHEVVASSKEGRLFEVFGGATHCPLLPFTRIVYQDTTMVLNHGQVCQGLDKLLRDTMTANPADNEWITPFE